MLIPGVDHAPLHATTLSVVVKVNAWEAGSAHPNIRVGSGLGAGVGRGLGLVLWVGADVGVSYLKQSAGSLIGIDITYPLLDSLSTTIEMIQDTEASRIGLYGAFIYTFNSVIDLGLRYDYLEAADAGGDAVAVAADDVDADADADAEAEVDAVTLMLMPMLMLMLMLLLMMFLLLLMMPMPMPMLV